MSLGVTSVDPAKYDALPVRARMMSSSLVLHPGGLYRNGDLVSQEPSTTPMTTSPGDTWCVSYVGDNIQFYHNEDCLSWKTLGDSPQLSNAVSKIKGKLWAVVELGLGTQISINDVTSRKPMEKSSEDRAHGDRVTRDNDLSPRRKNVNDISQLK